MSPPLLDPQFKLVRRAYVVFYALALPLFLFSFFAIALGWQAWPHRGEGVMEGPEPTDAEVLCAGAALGLFGLCYVFVWIFAPRVESPKRAWLPFFAHMPALLSLAIIFGRWSSMTATDRLYTILYPIALLLVLAFGIYLSIRGNAQKPLA